MSSRNSRRLVAALFALALASPLAAAPREDRVVTPFSAATPGAGLPEGWAAIEIRGVEKSTVYTLVNDAGTTVLRADADASASAVVYPIHFPAVDTLLGWRWKISHVLQTSDPTTKEGDDYPARVYVMFDYPLERLPLGDRIRLRLARAFYDPATPAAALCYVWDSRLPKETIIKSPYTARVRVIVANSGDERAGRWQTVTRDLAADFRRAFGEEPPPISAVALATDTDNTEARVTAWYGNIVLKKRAVTAPAK